MKLSVVIPCRKGEIPEITLTSLQKQTFKDFTIIIQPDFELLGANWARNRGFESVRSDLVLFADDDIDFYPTALKSMVTTLESFPNASYAYGGWILQPDGLVQCNHEFDSERLMQINYISTMSVIRTKHFPGFDERILRLQDWDLWLTMLEQEHYGVYCQTIIFTTNRRDGISYPKDRGITYNEAYDIVRAKHASRRIHPDKR